jgi:hypothetical protein
VIFHAISKPLLVNDGLLWEILKMYFWISEIAYQYNFQIQMFLWIFYSISFWRVIYITGPFLFEMILQCLFNDQNHPLALISVPCSCHILDTPLLFRIFHIQSSHEFDKIQSQCNLCKCLYNIYTILFSWHENNLPQYIIILQYIKIYRGNRPVSP